MRDNRPRRAVLPEFLRGPFVGSFVGNFATISLPAKRHRRVAAAALLRPAKKSMYCGCQLTKLTVSNFCWPQQSCSYALRTFVTRIAGTFCWPQQRCSYARHAFATRFAGFLPCAHCTCLARTAGPGGAVLYLTPGEARSQTVAEPGVTTTTNRWYLPRRGSLFHRWANPIVVSYCKSS